MASVYLYNIFNMSLLNRFGKPLYFFSAALIILVGTYFFNKWATRSPDLRAVAAQMQIQLRVIEQRADTLLQNTKQLEEIIAKKAPLAILEQLAAQKYTLCLYKNDSLLYWSNTRVLPTRLGVTEREQSSFYQLNNGKYEVIQKRLFLKDSAHYSAAVLIPITREYANENDYLQNGIALEGKYPNCVKLDARNGGSNVAIKNKDGLVGFYLWVDKSLSLAAESRGTVLLGYFLALLMLCIGINGVAIRIAKDHDRWLGFIVLAIMVMLMRNWSNFWHLSSEFRDVSLFNPNRFNYSTLTASLGDLIINVGLLTWIVVFFYREVNIRPLQQSGNTFKLVLVGIFYFMILSGIYTIDGLVNAIVLRSGITLDINDLYRLDEYSFWALLTIIFMMGNLFLFSLKVSYFIGRLHITLKSRLAFLAAIVVVFTLLNLTNALSFNVFILLFFGVTFIVLLDIFVQRKAVTGGWVAVWLVLFSAFSSYLIYYYNGEKDLSARRQLAALVTQDRDIEGEPKIMQIQVDLLKDSTLYSLYLDPSVGRDVIEQRVKRLFFGNAYLNSKYQITIRLFDAFQQPIKGEKSAYSGLEYLIKESQIHLGVHTYFWNFRSSFATYLMLIPVRNGQGTQAGYLGLEIVPRSDKPSAVFNDLLTTNTPNSYSTNLEEYYNYAIYEDDNKSGVYHLISQQGKGYNELLHLKKPPMQGYDYILDESDRSHLVVRKGDKIVLVTKQNETLLQPFSLFSYLFFILTILLTILALVNYLVGVLPDGIMLVLRPGLSLRSQIQYFVIGIIMASFLLVGAVSITYIKNNYGTYLSERLLNKTKAVIDHEFQSRPDSLSLSDINKLADVTNADINIYNNMGVLQQSSAPTLYDNGIISRRLPANVMFQLESGEVREVTREESIEKFKYKTLYIPLKNNIGKQIGFLGMPYNAYSDKALRRDIGNFVQTLLNFYVLLLLLAGLITLTIANSVTRPLQIIGEKLQRVRLGQNNEPLRWESNDEIGVLVAEYNKMIVELEQSANLLAQSEREGAWREMARQVAHEIKNPLTPMKLNLQLLQRSFERGDLAETQAMFKRVSGTLIEQIDNLSNIATEFSNFAKMPRAVNERFLVNDVVSRVFKFFSSSNDTIDWSMAAAPDDLYVFADRNQLIQVLNNILKNAEQAIPETRRGEVNLILYQRDNLAVIQVSDNGTGISEEKLHKIFTPNFTTKNSGTGLGLSISRQIINTAGGDITFQSVENYGTDFFVELPIADETEE